VPVPTGHDRAVTRRRTLLSGSLLVGQAVAEAVAAFWAQLVINGIGPEDVPPSITLLVARGEETGAATAVLIVLAVLSLAGAVERFRGRVGGRGLLVAAHLAGGAAVLLHGSPLLCAVLVALGLGWAVASRLRPATDRSRAPSRETAYRPGT